MEAGFTTGFTMSLGTKATINASGEEGTIHGRAEYDNAEPSYFMRYKGADGKAVEAWWPQSALTSIESQPVTATAL